MAETGTIANPIKKNTRNITAKSVEPTSVAVTRKNNAYTLGWKRGKTHGNKAYKKQEVRFRRKVRSGSNGDFTWRDWSSVSVTATATSASKAYALTDYYPHTELRLSAIQAEVRGLENDWSQKSSAYQGNGVDPSTGRPGTVYYYDLYNYNMGWSDYVKALYDIKTPNIPKISAPTVTSSSTAFPFSVAQEETRFYADMEYTSRLIKGWGTKDPSSGITWDSGTGRKTGTNSNTSGTITITEDTGLIGGTDSYTRVIRMRSRGAAGASSWAYKMYVHALPYRISASDVKVTMSDISGGYRATVSFTPNRTDQHPCETFRVEYCIGTPQDGNMTLPASPSWTSAGDAFSDKSGKASTTFTIGQRLTTDQALWVRVVQIHDIYETPGWAKFVQFGGVPPVGQTDLDVTSYDSSTKRVTLTCANPSGIATAKLNIAVYYQNTDGKWKHLEDLTIAHGSTTVTKKVDLNVYDKYAFDTVVSIGNDYESSAVRTTYVPKKEATNPAAFFPDIGSVNKGDSAGTIVVKWANVMKNVTEARVTVATDSTEWSKADPTFVEDVTVTGTNIKTATITGLTHGTTYYVKVKTTNANGTSDWSDDTGRITLQASAIPTPNISLAETSLHNIKVSWDWSRWSDATAINISWSDKKNFGKTDRKANEVTIDKKGNAGSDYYIITDSIVRGVRWYVQAEFTSENITSNPSTADIDLEVTPVPPSNITATRSPSKMDEPGKTTVYVHWDNDWEDADATEVTWAESKYCWNSTEGLNSYSLTGSEGRKRYLLISNLEMGKKWYFKVKFSYDGRFETSLKDIDYVELDLRTDPETPKVTMGAKKVSESSQVDISWTYECEDLAEQSAMSGQILNGSGTVLKSFGQSGAEKSFALYPEALGLTGNNTYYVRVRTTSANGRVSEWSETSPIIVVTQPTATITATSLVNGELTTLPLTVTVGGADNGGIVTVYIERGQAYFEEAPDEDRRGGYEGELMAMVTREGSGMVSIDKDAIRGFLNDSAQFRIVAIVTDDFGKSAPVTMDFEVAWSHQAVLPSATREVDVDNMIAMISATAPEEAVEGDVIDIYRLSADKPELIVEGGTFGETYVDPYPAFGQYGGHRVVYRTLNGDITTEGGVLAWVDLDGSVDASIEGAETDARLNSTLTVINFGNDRIDLEYNMSLSHSWEKDFQEVQYLGGSVQGYWNPAVSRKATVDSVAVSYEDTELIRLMRRLAVYDGICHVRTPEGSSFAADVQVSEDRSYDTAGKIVGFSLSITRVDPERLDGMTLAEWQEEAE